MDRGELEDLDRESLVVRAQAAGIRRARILTRPELIDELLRLDPSADDASLRRSRGFFGRARDLVARVVERGLHLPDAADRIRTLSLGTLPPYASGVPRTEPQAMPTVTLAEIYAAQGHRDRAIETLRRVLEREPEHAAARALLARLEDDGYVAPPPPLPPEPEIEPELNADAEEEHEDAGEGGDKGRVAADAEDEHADIAPPFAVRAIATLEPSDVDVHAKTDVFDIVPEQDEPGAATTTDEAARLDECIAIPIARDDAGGRTYVHWGISRRATSAMREAAPNGRFVVRTLVVTPSWDGPEKETRDLSVDPDAEQVTLGALPVPSVVRVAVGWLDGSTFVPLAHSPALEMTQGRGLVIWETQGAVPVVLDDPRAASIARAVDASRRAVQPRV